MQTCSCCATQSADSETTCPKCQADLREFSMSAMALKRFCANPRVKNVRLVVAFDACPACQAEAGTFDKEKASNLPVAGCSEKNGCRCFYEPMLDEIYP